MTEVYSCPSCGAQLGPGTSSGAPCPACLFAAALEPPDEPLELLLPPDSTLGAFRIAGVLGKGGMATVYEAYDSSLERAVALKVLPPEFLHDDSFARRFRREGRVIARLEHPNIVPIYASGIDDRIPWMSMRLLDGGSLAALLEHSRLPIERSLEILHCVAGALDYAHARGVVHRDIKPSNILLDRSGHVCVADFGLAYIRDFNLSFSRSTTIAGTPHYMAPELGLGKAIDHRSDIYSLGVLAYEMLTGAVPFTADSPIAIMLKHINERPPSTNELPVPLVRAIHRALAKNPEERWASAGAFTAALDAARVETPMAAAWRRVRPPFAGVRNRRVMGGVAMTVALGMTIYWLPGQPAPGEAPGLSDASDITLSPGAFPAPSDIPQPPPVDISPTSGAMSPAAKGESSRPTEGTQRFENGVISMPFATASMEAIPAPASSLAVPLALTPPETSTHVGAFQAQTSPVQTPSSDVLIPPTRTQMVNPIYPAVARAANLAGDVGLQALVGVDGKVIAVTVVRPIHPLLDDAAKKAVLQYQYRPGLKNGVPHAMTTDIVVSFRLE